MVIIEYPLQEVKECNFLGTIIDNNKGSLNKGSQELSKNGIQVLFSLRNIFSSFTQLARSEFRRNYVTFLVTLP